MSSSSSPAVETQQSTTPLRLGANVGKAGVEYCVWAPKAESMEVNLYYRNSFDALTPVRPGHLPLPARTLPLEKTGEGYFRVVDEEGSAGDFYTYRLDGGSSFPDPASRCQPLGVHGPSMVMDPTEYVWRDQNWKRTNVRDLVIYELHIGTFTVGGTFLSAIERLQHVRELGANAIEIMPIGAFPGERNWGYDGVYLYAPAPAYGPPDDFKALVDAAHQIGLTVILDVVYNHFGPDGNYLGAYIGEYLDEAAKTPWGGAIRYGSPDFRPLREMVAQNPAYWMREFHVDGFRLDATHAIVDESQPHLLQELTSSIHSLGGFAIAEDPRNEAQLLLPPEENGLGFDGVWADDFHHCTRVPNTGEQDAYLADFSGSLEEVLETLRHGWLYRGQESRVQGKPRGTECSHIAPEKFFHCISNHDQTGNHAFGERLGHKISPEAYRAASALLLLSPYAPLLFMGQEWNASTPFQFFTDHNDELGRLITEGRREEFKDFAAFRDPEVRHRIPDPQSVQTFRDSKLRWEDLSEERHAKVLALYRSCLQLRLSDAAFRPQSRDSYRVSDIDSGVGAIQLFAEKADWLMLFDLVGGHSGSLLKNIPAPTADGHWQLVLSSNEERFGGTKSGDEILSADIEFPAAECAVYRWDK